MSGDVITVAEAAALEKCSADTIKRRIKNGEIPAVKVGRAFRIDRSALTADHEYADWGSLFDRLERAITNLETKAATP